jgi:hypothetical protein
MGKHEKQWMGSNLGLWKFEVRNDTVVYIYICMLIKNSFKHLVKQCLAEVIVEAPEPQENKLGASERNKISKAFAAAHLDGNGSFQKKEHGLQAITAVLDSLGFKLDMVSSDIIMGDQGSRNLSFRRNNDPGQDPFTEKREIENSRIVFSWYNRSQPGNPANFEILAYAS